MVGLNSNLSVRELKRKFGTEWYPDKEERKDFGKWKKIYKEIERRKNRTGQSCEALANEIDEERESQSMTLSRYMESLRKSKEDDKD